MAHNPATTGTWPCRRRDCHRQLVGYARDERGPGWNLPPTWYFMNLMVALLHELWYFGGTTEIMKEIVGRGLGL